MISGMGVSSRIDSSVRISHRVVASPWLTMSQSKEIHGMCAICSLDGMGDGLKILTIGGLEDLDRRR